MKPATKTDEFVAENVTQIVVIAGSHPKTGKPSRYRFIEVQIHTMRGGEHEASVQDALVIKFEFDLSSI